MYIFKRALFGLLLTLVGTATCSAATLTWPGVAPCAGTISACINGAASGDTIEIAANSVDQLVSASFTNKSLVIRPATGFTPVVGPNRDWFFRFVTGNCGLRVTGLTFDSTRLSVSAGSSTATGNLRGTIEFDHLRVTRIGDHGLEVTVSGSTANPANVDVVIHDNWIEHLSTNPTANSIKLVTLATDVIGHWRVYDNTIRAAGLASTAYGNVGILVYPWSRANAGVSMDLFANRILPQNWPLAADDGVHSGIQIFAPAGTQDNHFRIANNLIAGPSVGNELNYGSFTVDDYGNNTYAILNNTFLAGQPAAVIARFTGTSTGEFANNIVKGGTAQGIRFGGTALTQLNNHDNIVFGAPANVFTPGPNTISSDPQLDTAGLPRPKYNSPALNAGSSSSYLAVEPSALAAPKLVDADGLLRIKGSAIDIGAFEGGDLSFKHDVSLAGTSSELNYSSLNGKAGAVLQITRSDGRTQNGMVLTPHPLSKSYAAAQQRWSLVTENEQNMVAAAGFTLYQLPSGGWAGTHVATAETLLNGPGSDLPEPWASAPADWIFLVSNTHGNGLSSVSNPHPIGARHDGTRWQVVNVDHLPIPVGAAFTVYAQPPSNNAFDLFLGIDNVLPDQSFVVSHPLLNGKPCAALHLTIHDGVGAASRYASAHYDAGLQRWKLVSAETGSNLLMGGRIFVVVDPKASPDTCPVGETSFSVTPTAHAYGSFAPAAAQTVALGDTTFFDITPNASHRLVSASGCGGTLVGARFTTSPINADCAVTAVFNANPVAGNSAIVVLEDAGASYGQFTSADDGPLTYHLVSAPSKGTVLIDDPTSGDFFYTPNANANGADSFTFRVNDGGADSAVATVSVTITPVNDAPTFTIAALPNHAPGSSGARSFDEFLLNFDLGPPDEDTTQSVSSYNIVEISDPNNVVSAINLAVGSDTLEYTLSGNAGSATFSLTLTDSGSNAPPNDAVSDAQNFSITVNNGTDLEVSKTNGRAFLRPGENVVYEILVGNAGPYAVSNASLTDIIPAGLSDVLWSCDTILLAICPQANGAGNISQANLTLPVGAVLRYQVTATVSAAHGAVIANTASVRTPVSMPELDTFDNDATDSDAVDGDTIFINGFETTTSVLSIALPRGVLLYGD